ncbi:FtsK/SpoIIIE domain-containing protein [Micrococcoides hystricis]|uniref:FtsK/SpoIIIE domain-containing protein n=1 Tax=Micrococcoides hystricis TaxID=1572761 RepID=A0ABV6P8K3_9MICC
MRSSLPLAVLIRGGRERHYWLDNMTKLDPDSFRRVLDSLPYPDQLCLKGQVPQQWDAEFLSQYRTGILLRQSGSEPTLNWHQDLSVVVLAGPATGTVMRLEHMVELSDHLNDEHISPGTTLIQKNGRLFLVASGRSKPRPLVLNEPFVLGGSILLVQVPHQLRHLSPATRPLQLPTEKAVPNRHYLLYLVLALAPLAIGIVLIVAFDMWFFMIFGVLGLLGGAIPYLQGRREWRSFRQVLNEHWLAAEEIHARCFAPQQQIAPISKVQRPLHITLGYGMQPPPLVLPELPRKLQPTLPDLVPVGLTLHHVTNPDTAAAAQQRTASAHALQPAPLLFIDASIQQQNVILLHVLTQLIPQLGTRSCWVTGDEACDELMPLASWLRFFPQIKNFRSADEAEQRINTGDVLISLRTSTQLREDLDLIRIVIDESYTPCLRTHWRYHHGTGSLSFRPSAEETTLSPSPARVNYPATSTHASAIRRMQGLIEAGHPAADEDTGLYDLPIGDENCATRLHAVLGFEGHDRPTQPAELDLVADGPHMLLVGTTGSGKSVLLRRLVTEWVSRHTAEELNMVLVDFKGGATFVPFKGLAHCSAHLTDLDAENTARLLVSIRAELRRREELFSAHQVSDYGAFRAHSPEPLPRMVVMIDEFAVFATEQPDALDELMHLATIGRSLGFHLILATQRTGGHLSLGLRSNLSIKICLRVLNENESHELIGSSAAAHLRPDQPGYAFLHTSGSTALPFRVIAHSTARSPRLRELGEPFHRTQQHETAELMSLLEHLPDDRKTFSAPPDGAAKNTLLLPSLPLLIHASQPQVLAHLDIPQQRAQPRLILGSTDDYTDVSSRCLAVIGQRPTSDIRQRFLSGPEASRRIILLSGDEVTTRLPLAGYAASSDPLTGYQILEHLRDELSHSASQPSTLILEDLRRWLSGCEQHGLYDFEPLVHDLLRLTRNPDSRFTLVLGVDPTAAHHQLVNACEHRIYLPHGVSEQHRMLWPQAKTLSDVPNRGYIIGTGFDDTGVLCQLASAQPTELTTLNEDSSLTPQHRWMALPDLDVFDSTLSDSTQFYLGRTGLEREPLYRNLTGLVTIIGPSKSGKSAMCRLICQQQPKAVTVDGIETLSQQELAELQSRIRQDSRELIIVTTTPEQLRRPTLSFLHAHLQSGTHILLRPSNNSHFDPYLIPPVALSSRPAGRGILIEDGQTCVFQAGFVSENTAV